MGTPRPGAELAGRNPGGRTQPEDRQWDSTPEHSTTCGLNSIEETARESHDRGAEEGHQGQDFGLTIKRRPIPLGAPSYPILLRSHEITRSGDQWRCLTHRNLSEFLMIKFQSGNREPLLALPLRTS